MDAQFGLALKNNDIERILTDIFSDEPQLQRIQSIEVIAENIIRGKESLRKSLDRLSNALPTSIHCLTMSPGGLSPLNLDLIRSVRELANRVGATHITDHLCFSSFEGIESNSLLPLPFTRESLSHVANRVDQIQNILKLPFGLENTSYFFHFPNNEMSEADFISALVKRTGCSILLDVNNIIVSSFNTSISKTYEEALIIAQKFIRSLPTDQIVEVHVAGHALRQRNSSRFIVDNHGAWPQQEVLTLLREILSRSQPKSVILERDQNIPPLKDLIDELMLIKKIVSSDSISTTEYSKNDIFPL